MKKAKPTYKELETRLAKAEPVIEALKGCEIDAIVGQEKIAFLLLRQVEEAWLESNGEFVAMFNLGGIGMIQADSPNFRISRVNPKFCEMTGFSSEELLAQTYIGLTHPEDRRRGLKELARVMRGKTDAWSIEKRCICKGGQMIWVNVHGLALRNDVGRVAKIIAMIEDVTSRKMAEQEQSDAREHMKKRLKELNVEVSSILRPLRGQVADRKKVDQVLRAIRDFSDPYIGAKSSANPRKSIPRKKSPSVKTRKPADKARSGKPKPPLRKQRNK